MLALFGEQTAIDTSANLLQEDPVLQAEGFQDLGSSSSRRFRRQLRGVDEYPANGTARDLAFTSPSKLVPDEDGSQWSTDFQKLYEQIMPEKPETSLTLLGRENPCNNIFKAREFLEQTHALENMREDFLERELEKMCLESGQESQYAEHITAGMKRSKPVPSHQNRKTIEVVEP